MRKNTNPQMDQAGVFRLSKTTDFTALQRLGSVHGNANG